MQSATLNDVLDLSRTLLLGATSSLGTIGRVTVMNLLLDSSGGLLVEGGVLEQEGQLLKGAAGGLGVEEVHNAQLEEDPTAVDGKVLPLDGVEGD